MKAKLLRQLPIHPKRVAEGFPPFYEQGHVIDHPHAYRLVQQGVAIPADRECEEKARMTNAKMDAAIVAYDRLDNGIHPEDFDAYSRGLLSGYKPDGKTGDTWKPGPNFYEGCEAEYYSGNEDEDDDE
jgi:hypothetical protein